MTPSQTGDAPVHPCLHLGTSSFSASSWVGPFYPPRTKPTEFLAVYGRRYETVEIDATFYRIPSAAQGRSWASKVPDGFHIAAKVPQVVTHEKLLLGTEEDMKGRLREGRGPRSRFHRALSRRLAPAPPARLNLRPDPAPSPR